MRFFILCTILAALAAGGCKKKATPSPKKEEPAAAPAPEPVDPRNSAPIAGGGLGANLNQVRKRAVTQNDLSQLGLLIFDMELTTGKLPSAKEIKASLMGGEAASIRKLIDEGVIILTDTTDKSSLWAYEVDADKAGGLVLTGPTPNVRRVSAEDAKALIGK